MRFRDNGDGTVTDTSTGLMWKKERSSFPVPRSREGFQTARQYCKDLIFAGYRDWRLPIPDELHRLYRALKKEKYAPFRWEPDFYWCIEYHEFCGNLDYPNGTVEGCLFDFERGRFDMGTSYILSTLKGYVRAVRSGNKPQNIDIHK